MVFTSVSIDKLEQVAEQICNLYSNYSVWLLNGRMGAGKTTFTKSLCNFLKCTTEASSPSFGIVNEYKTISEKSIFHFDCYRFKTEDEAYDIGMEEYLDSGSLCLIEWAEKIPNLLPSNYLIIDLIVETNTLRTIKVSTHG